MPGVQTPTKDTQAKIGAPDAQSLSALPAPLERAKVFFANLWSLDLRSLAVFRIGLALVILFDLMIRASDLEAFYTDFGILPRAPYLQNFADQWFVSLHMMSGTFLVQACLFLLAGIFTFLMLVGYRTRLFTM